MLCEWKNVRLNGVQFSTSISGPEGVRLRQLSRDKRVLEIGAAYGYSTCVMAANAEHVTSVDPHEWIAGSYEAMKRNVEVLGLEHKVDILRTTSFDAALTLFNADKEYDFIFIDGDHAYPAVLHDYQAAVLLLAEAGGTIACHDYGEDTCPGVSRALDKLASGPDEVVDTLWIKHFPGKEPNAA